MKERTTGLLHAARDEYAAEARAGRGNRAVLARYADRIDGLVRDIAEVARAQTAAEVTVCALGGYGRRALCLHSDIDLLLVFGEEIGKPEERFVNTLLHPLWDLRLTIGHHVRTLADFDQAETDNPELLLALLDRRWLAGDERLFARMNERLSRLERAGTRYLLDALLTLVRQRYERFNATFFQLEPDIKNAPGTLRDIGAVRVMRRLAPSAFADISATDDTLAETEDVLFRVRSLLHVESNRDMNVLSHELQEKAAETLGYPGDHAHSRVERLMSDYFRRARVVARALESARTVIAPPSTAPPPRRRLDRNFELARDGVRFANLGRAAAMPAIWLEAFRVALVNGCRVSEQARTCIERNIDRCNADDFVATEGARQQLRTLLAPRAGLYDRLSEMHDCGLLECIFPEFGRVHSRVIRDFYHKYTVDEHTLLAIRNLEILKTSSVQGHERFSTMLGEVRSPELLVLALLYHDVGKWRDTEHVEESVELAQPMFDRLQLPQKSCQTIEFLIRHHLAMSQVAFRRDSEDPEVVARFADLVGTEERLKLLCLLTFADVGAVSPETLTPWKEELLWRLYVDTYNHLTLGYADEPIRQHEARAAVAMAGRPGDISEHELSEFLDGLPHRYLALFGLSNIYNHVRLARGLAPDEVHATLEKHDDVWELTVVTRDRPFLFSNISGVLSHYGMDIHRGQAITTPQGLVLDVFEFTDDEGFLRQNARGTSEIVKTLNAVVAESVDVPKLLRGRERSILYRKRRHVDLLVALDNEHSRKYTVLEIVADDVPGLLYRISRAVSRQGCAVDLALISTEGRKAIDVLHVTKQGKKLSESDQVALKQELIRLLEGNHEAD